MEQLLHQALKNISTGIGFRLNPELPELFPLSTLPTSLDAATLLPLLLPLLRKLTDDRRDCGDMGGLGE
jgi:hypothetical protein